MSKPYYKADNFECRKSIGYLVRRLNNLLMPRAEALFADQELTFSHWIILMQLRENLADTCADLARHMNHDTGATTRLVDQLEQRGLIERTRSTEDRRVVHLSLTAEGKQVARSLLPRVIGNWNGLLEDFTHSEVTVLIELLTRLLMKIDADTPVPEKVKVAR